MVNIGSQLGFEAMVFGKIIGPKGKMFIFEPSEVTRKILVKNIYLNDHQDITTVYPYAAGNTKTTAYLVINQWNIGASIVQTNETIKNYNGRNDGVK